jgi:uncharacterized protein YecE (DUF72 family)
MENFDPRRFTAPPDFAPFLKIGTCSWKYDSWKGLVYDEAKKYHPDDYLRDYARHFKSVEVDQWFWSLFAPGPKLPETKTVKSYAAAVPDDFIFTVKAPNSLTLTHFYAKKEAGQGLLAGQPNKHFLDVGLLNLFLERLSPLGRKLGPIMFQFEYLNKSKMPTKEAFFERLDSFFSLAPRDFIYSVEIRNPNYLSPAFFDFLKARRLGFVFLEGYYMPPIASVFEKFKPETADFSIVRLHGGDRLEIETETGEVWDKIVSPKPQGIQAAARIVRHNIERKILSYVNVNNHFEGSAPLTIERFLRTLEEESPSS